MVSVFVDPSSASPVYRQVYDQVKQAILSGHLGAGQKLPPVRDLSARLHVSHLTVHRAYQLLAEEQMLDLRHGSGAYVAAIKQREQATVYLKQFLKKGPMRDFEQTAHSAQVDSLATMAPDLRLFETNCLMAEMANQVKNDPWAFGYTPEQGSQNLRKALSDWVAEYGLNTDPDQMIIGSHPTNSLGCGALNPGDHVLVEQPFYLFAGDWMAKQNLVPVGIPPTKEGIDLAFLRQAQKNDQIKAVIVAPSLGFGTGQNWSASSRQAFLEVAKEAGWLVIENFSRAPLSFQEKLRPLATEDSQVPILTQIHFSELLAPGINLSSTIANHNVSPEVFSRLIQSTVHPLQPLEMAVGKLLKDGLIPKTISQSSKTYSNRFNLFNQGLKQTLPEGFEVSDVQGAYSTVISAPYALPPADLFQATLDANCPVLPGIFTGIRGACQNLIRVNFGSVEERSLTNTGTRLGEVLTKLIHKHI